MLRITVEPSLLSAEQRHYVADFIRNYPHALADVEPVEDEQLVTIPAFTVASDDDETTAEEAFGATTSEPSPKLDKTGLPWDARIHTSTRAVNADGTWRRKRGVDEATVATVESELRAVMGIPAVAVPAPTVAEAAPVVPPPPPAPVAPLPPSTASFIDLINLASELIMAGKLTQAQLDSAVQSTGVPSLALLANRLDLVPGIIAQINGMAA